MIFLLAAAVWVGSDACQPCHSQIYKSYMETPMAASSGVAREIPPGTLLHRASRTSYEIRRDGIVRYRRPGGTGEQRLRFFVGSGAAGQSYLIERDGYLYQAPLTWYTGKKHWDASPGYQDDLEPDWSRPIDPSCLSCHASQLAHIYGTVNRYADPPFRQAGVGCERCHGPGSEHAAGKARMVSPGKLDAARRDDVCRQCHLQGEARIERTGRRFLEYRAGDLLSEFVAYFVMDEAGGGDLKVTSHVEKLALSRCKQTSGDQLWCGSCHDPHGMPKNRALWFQDKCLSCHKPQECNRGADCAACHMPKSRAVDAGHGVFTDHSIPRRALPRTARGEAAWRLRPFSRRDAGDREMGLAYAQLYQRTNDARHKAEAEKLLGARIR